MHSFLAAASLAFSSPLLAPRSVCRSGCDAALPPQPIIALPRPVLARASVPVAVAGPAELWSGYLGLLETAPLVTKAISAGVIIGAGDAAAQTVENSQTGGEFDFTRYLRWAFFGLVLQGPWNHFFYLLLDGAIPPTPDPFTISTLEKVTIDQFIQAPIFTVVILGFFAIVEGKGLGFAKDQVKNDLGGILVKNWSVFLPATFINLAYCPPELRVLFLNCTHGNRMSLRRPLRDRTCSAVCTRIHTHVRTHAHTSTVTEAQLLNASPPTLCDRRRLLRLGRLPLPLLEQGRR